MFRMLTIPHSIGRLFNSVCMSELNHWTQSLNSSLNSILPLFFSSKKQPTYQVKVVKNMHAMRTCRVMLCLPRAENGVPLSWVANIIGKHHMIWASNVHYLSGVSGRSIRRELILLWKKNWCEKNSFSVPLNTALAVVFLWMWKHPWRDLKSMAAN